MSAEHPPDQPPLALYASRNYLDFAQGEGVVSFSLHSEAVAAVTSIARGFPVENLRAVILQRPEDTDDSAIVEVPSGHPLAFLGSQESLDRREFIGRHARALGGKVLTLVNNKPEPRTLAMNLYEAADNYPSKKQQEPSNNFHRWMGGATGFGFGLFYVGVIEPDVPAEQYLAWPAVGLTVGAIALTPVFKHGRAYARRQHVRAHTPISVNYSAVDD